MPVRSLAHGAHINRVEAHRELHHSVTDLVSGVPPGLRVPLPESPTDSEHIIGDALQALKTIGVVHDLEDQMEDCDQQDLEDRVHAATTALDAAICGAIEAGLEVELTTYTTQGRTYPAVTVRQVLEPSVCDAEAAP